MILIPTNTDATVNNECGVTGEWEQTNSVTTDNCGSVDLGIVRIVSGSTETITTYRSKLTGEVCESTTSTKCSAGNRWQWFWE